MEFLARMVLFGGVSMALLGCGEDHPTASEPVLNIKLRSHNMGAYLIRLWDQARGELLYTDERMNVWIDWQLLDPTILGERRPQINGTYDIQFENTTDRKVGVTLIRLSFKNARNGPVPEFLYAPERQIALEPMEVLYVNGEFQAVVDDLSQAEVIVNIGSGRGSRFRGEGSAGDRHPAFRNWLNEIEPFPEMLEDRISSRSGPDHLSWHRAVGQTWRRRQADIVDQLRAGPG